RSPLRRRGARCRSRSCRPAWCRESAAPRRSSLPSSSIERRTQPILPASSGRPCRKRPATAASAAPAGLAPVPARVPVQRARKKREPRTRQTNGDPCCASIPPFAYLPFADLPCCECIGESGGTVARRLRGGNDRASAQILAHGVLERLHTTLQPL